MTATPPKSSSSSHNLEDDHLVAGAGTGDEESESEGDKEGGESRETDSQRKWDCKRCTYSNYPSAQLCTMCRQPRHMRPLIIMNSHSRCICPATATSSSTHDLIIKASTSDTDTANHPNIISEPINAESSSFLPSSSFKQTSPTVPSPKTLSLSSISCSSAVVDQSGGIRSSSSTEHVDPTERRWPCPACTFENVLQASYCSICSHERPIIYNEEVRQLKTKCAESNVLDQEHMERINKALRKWSCSLCTFKNWPNVKACTMCRTPKQTTSTPAIVTSRESVSVEEDFGTASGWSSINNINNKNDSKDKNNSSLQRTSVSGINMEMTLNAKNKNKTETASRITHHGATEENVMMRAVAKDVSNTLVMSSGETRLSPFEEKISFFDRYLMHLERSVDTGCYAFLEALAGFMQPGNENGDKFVNYIYEYGESNRRITAFECALLNGFDDNGSEQCLYNHTLLELLNERRQESMNDVMPTLFINSIFTNNHFVDFPGTDVDELSTYIYDNIRAKIRDDYDMRRIMNTGEHFTLPVEVYNMRPWLTTGADRLRVFMDFDERQIMKTICFGDTLSVDNLLGGNVYAPLLLCNRGGGHSLVDAASQAMWGVLDQHDYLRDAIYHTLCMKESIFRNRWATSLLKMGMKFDVWLMERCWASVMDCHEPGTSMEQIHVLVLAQVLNRPIVVLPMESARLYLRRPSATIRRATLKHPFEGFYPQLPSLNSYRCCSPLFLAFSNGSFHALVLPSQQPKSLAIRYDQQQQPTSPPRSNGPSTQSDASLNKTTTAASHDTNKTGSIIENSSTIYQKSAKEQQCNIQGGIPYQHQQHSINNARNQNSNQTRQKLVQRNEMIHDEEVHEQRRQRRLIHRHVLCSCNDLQDYVQFAFDKAEAERFVRDGMWFDEDDDTGTKWFYHSMVTMPKPAAASTRPRTVAAATSRIHSSQQPTTQQQYTVSSAAKNVAIGTSLTTSTCSSSILQQPSNAAIGDHDISSNDENLTRTEADEAVSMGNNGRTNENEFTLTDLSSLLWKNWLIKHFPRSIRGAQSSEEDRLTIKKATSSAD